MAIKRRRAFGTFLASRLTGLQDHAPPRPGHAHRHQPDERSRGAVYVVAAKQSRENSGRFGEFIGLSATRSRTYPRRSPWALKCPKCNEGEFVRRAAPGKGGRGRSACSTAARVTRSDSQAAHAHRRTVSTCGAPFFVEKRTKIGNVHSCSKKAVIGREDCPKSSRKHSRREVRCPGQAKF